MKRVITGILAMLIVLPALEITSGINGATASLPLGGLEMLHMQALTGGTNASAFDSSLKVGPGVCVLGMGGGAVTPWLGLSQLQKPGLICVSILYASPACTLGSMG
jgi:hypothetical protein